MRVLGIETSCDETAVAIYDEELGLLSHALHSQVEIHAKYGGVVPELASRDHIVKLLPLVNKVLEDSKLTLQDINAIAYTAGPGLIGALLVGACFAKSLAYTLNLPAIEIHHMEGHLLAALMEEPKPSFPFIGLLVSGGHTLLVEVKNIGQYRILGESIDDAAGEAFDKTAKLLGLGYPGGPLIAALAKKGNPSRFHFPRPLTDRPGLDFSFSGLKTFAMNTIQRLKNKKMEDRADSEISADQEIDKDKIMGNDKSIGDMDAQDKADVAFAFQEAVADTLLIKCRRAIKQTGLSRLVVAGGVGANLRLRSKLAELTESHQCEIFYPSLEFCTDNGAMIAFAGFQRIKTQLLSDNTLKPLRMTVYPKWPMDQISHKI